MTNWLLLLGLPLAVYIGLVSLKAGRLAFWASLCIALILAGLWMVFLFDIGGLISIDGQAGAFVFISLLGLTIAWALASTLQILRLRMPQHWPAWAWPVCAVLTLIAAGLPLARLLGV